ncbi:hypothetical protein JCM6882_004417 [Rhodosporidiobolus microsporus]
MARTKVTAIPQPDPDSFTELLAGDLNLPISGPASSLRRWLPSLLWRMGHRWISEMEEREGLEATPIPPEPKYDQLAELRSESKERRTDTPSVEPLGPAPPSPAASSSATPLPLDSSTSSVSAEATPSQPWMKRNTAHVGADGVAPPSSREERARRRDERSRADEARRSKRMGESKSRVDGSEGEGAARGRPAGEAADSNKAAPFSRLRSSCTVKLPSAADLHSSPLTSPDSFKSSTEALRDGDEHDDGYILPFQLPAFQSTLLAHSPSISVQPPTSPAQQRVPATAVDAPPRQPASVPPALPSSFAQAFLSPDTATAPKVPASQKDEDEENRPLPGRVLPTNLPNVFSSSGDEIVVSASFSSKKKRKSRSELEPHSRKRQRVSEPVPKTTTQTSGAQTIKSRRKSLRTIPQSSSAGDLTPTSASLAASFDYPFFEI